MNLSVTLLNEITEEYYNKCARNECSILELYNGPVTGKLYNMGLLPNLISNSKALFVLHRIDCESHRDKMIFALKQK